LLKQFSGVAAAGISLNQTSKSASAAKEKVSNLGIEFLTGQKKLELVWEATRSKEFQPVYREFVSRGWSINWNNVKAFKVNRDNEYTGAILGFEKSNSDEGTGACYSHLTGEIPDELDYSAFGFIGEKSDKPTIKNTAAYKTEKKYFIPDENGDLSTEVEKFDPAEYVSSSEITPQDKTTPGNGGAIESCEMEYLKCTSVDWVCAVTIASAAVGVLSCAVQTIISWGWLLALCVGGVLVSLVGAYDCVNSDDCNVKSKYVTEAQWKKWKESGKYDMPSGNFDDFCRRYTIVEAP
jgi:hypothetical protein